MSEDPQQFQEEADHSSPDIHQDRHPDNGYHHDDAHPDESQHMQDMDHD